MKTLQLLFSLALVGLISTAFISKKGTRYDVSAAESQIEWIAKKVTGQHNGYVSVKTGSITLKDGKIESGEFVMDMTSITCLDLTNPEWSKKLVDHLKSDDFFSTANHGTASLKITKATAKGGNVHSIEGDLTIKGKTLPVTFDATVDAKDKTVTATAAMTVNRVKYNIQYRSGSVFENLGDKMIYDDFTLNVKLVAKAS